MDRELKQKLWYALGGSLYGGTMGLALSRKDQKVLGILAGMAAGAGAGYAIGDMTVNRHSISNNIKNKIQDLNDSLLDRFNKYAPENKNKTETYVVV